MRRQSSAWVNLRSVLLGAVVAALVIASFPAAAATVGDALRLGEANRIDARTTLSGAAPANLRVINTQAGGVALELRVPAGSAPLKVNSNARVPSLNADLLDGRHAAAFALAVHSHAVPGYYTVVADLAPQAPADPSLGQSTHTEIHAASGDLQAMCNPGDAAVSGVAHLSHDTSTGPGDNVFKGALPIVDAGSGTPLGWEIGEPVQLSYDKWNSGGTIDYVRQTLHVTTVCADLST